MVDSGCGDRCQVTVLIRFIFDTLFVLRECKKMSVCLRIFFVVDGKYPELFLFSILFLFRDFFLWEES